MSYDEEKTVQIRDSLKIQDFCDISLDHYPEVSMDCGPFFIECQVVQPQQVKCRCILEDLGVNGKVLGRVLFILI
jgi:hypothetical protein